MILSKKILNTQNPNAISVTSSNNPAEIIAPPGLNEDTRTLVARLPRDTYCSPAAIVTKSLANVFCRETQNLYNSIGVIVNKETAIKPLIQLSAVVLIFALPV